jgi:hypothetical protein
MLCETKTGCTSNIEIYRAQGKKLNDTIMSLLENNVGVHYHVYQDNFYNSVNLAEKLMKCNKIMWHNEAFQKTWRKRQKG